MNLVEVYALAGWREKALHKVDGALKLFGNDARLKRTRDKVVERRAPGPALLGTQSLPESQTRQIAAPACRSAETSKVLTRPERAPRYFSARTVQDSRYGFSWRGFLGFWIFPTLSRRRSLLLIAVHSEISPI